MNEVILTGRLTRDPDVRYTNGPDPVCIARFSLAVDRRFKREGEPEADFPSCVAFGKTGEFVERWAKKGGKFDIVGRLQTGKYQNREGQTVYTTEVVVEKIEFGESRSAAEAHGRAAEGGERKESKPYAGAPAGSVSGPVDENGFMNIPEGIEEELPFN